MKFNVNEIDLNVDDDFDKQIGSLTNGEIVKLIRNIETNVINQKYVNENIIFKLIKLIENRLEYAPTFSQYRKLVICIEKLLWLIKKNIDCEYNEKEEEQYLNIIKIDPNIRNSVIKLLDLENEREYRLMSFFRVNGLHI
ncbi:hypothetical protein ACJDT4_14050 [Clostridium neuense]|uniref:Uncharacterized protein n=1 Tax=Clostridium neuense TaxID=1728934 RepID=A0ABW8TJ68_9CLOT